MPMNLRSAYILQVHLFMLNLQETADLQTLWRQVRLLRQHSADLVSVPEIHLPTTRFLSDIQQETSLTEKALRYRTVRLLRLLLWMHVQSLQQRLTRDSLRLQQIWMWNTQDLHIILIRQYMKTEFLTVRELQTLNRRYSLVLISRTGHRW